MKFPMAALVGILLPCAAWAQAAMVNPLLPQGYLGYLNFAGVTATLKDAPEGGTVTSDIDQAKLLATVPLLQKMQVLNPDYKATYFAAHPITTDERMAELAAIMLMQGYFTDKTHNTLRIEEFVSAPDAQGAPRQRHFFTLATTRAAFEKIDIDHLKLGDLTKLTGAQFDPWATGAMADEAQH